MRIKKTIFLILLLLTGLFAVAQPTTDQQLAAHYFQAGEYDKAVMYYEKLYEKTPSDFFYRYYLKSLIQLEDYKTAEKLIKKQSRQFDTNQKYKVDLGDIYAKQGEQSKAEKQYEKAIKELPPNQHKVIELAKAFLQKGENQYALDTYEKGRKMLRGRYPFNFEIAEVHGAMNNYQKMIEEYLELLEVNPAYLQSVQNALGRALSFEKETQQNDILRRELLKRVQKQPNKTIYAEMLIWMFAQQKDFASAFMQAKALDKRAGENGQRLVALAKLCTSNKNYDIAIKAYQYVIEKGEETPYYISSKIALLNILNKKITETGNYTDEDIQKLEKNYYSTIRELGKSTNTVPLMKELAHLQAYYLHKPDTAIALLEEAIELPRIKPQVKAECKLKLGDILLLKGEVWDASLYYSQVEKAFKYDELGERAKFRNAKVAYYTGDFKWAKAYLDVLKGSTSKLIANDALDLSLLITDNTGVDTTEKPMLMYARADLLTVQNKDEEALAVLDSINNIYPGHKLEDEILFQRYKIKLKRKDYEKAAEFLQKIIDYYPDDILGDNALFHLAELNEKQFEDKEKAKELYQRLMVDYPGSLYTVEARKRFRELRGDNIN